MKKLLCAPYIDQTGRWINGCESVSAVMLLQYLGLAIDPDAFISHDLRCAPLTEADGERCGPDPHFVYAGDPRDHTGYGCYAPCICNALEHALARYGAAGYFAVRDETGKTAAQLCAEYIDAGMPVVFWATLNFEPAGPAEDWRLPDGSRFTWTSREHCLLLVGYDEENYWFNDPWQNRGLCPQPRALVEQRHREQGMYAVGLKRNY